MFDRVLNTPLHLLKQSTKGNFIFMKVTLGDKVPQNNGNIKRNTDPGT